MLEDITQTSEREDLRLLAQRLFDAARQVQAIEPLSSSLPNLTVLDAEAVQAIGIELREAQGEQIVGIKAGFTSRAKMIQMGVKAQIVGRLTNAMHIDDGGMIARDAYIHPRVEPEIAFRICKPLTGHQTMVECLAAIDAVAPALELIDSRYHDFTFSLVDVVADNTSAAGFVIGPWSSPNAAFDNLGLVLSRNGRTVEIGSSAAILGHPMRGFMAAMRHAHRQGIVLNAGAVVLAGAATAAISVASGDHVEVETRIGRAELCIS